MNNKIFVGLVVLAAGVLIGWVYFKGKTATVSVNQTVQTTPTPAGSNLGAPETISGTAKNGLEKGGVQARTVVTFTDKGFSPSPVTVKVGTTITFVNESSSGMWIASDPHPTHTLLPGFDELASVGKSGTYEYTFTKVGTWTYHNHLTPTVKGTVIVAK
ncbi:MAG: cupredoxin domain-containing protein [Candidatus Gottesmanbacteria bacterium]|nr:cupredoxin domain-containing protein [Candidatus Gottesmanbacteria bacterium]